MSEKRDKGKLQAARRAASPAPRPSLKVSIPIKLFLLRQKQQREAAKLEKRRLMLNKMKEEYKQRKAVVGPENNDIPKNINRGEKRAPEVPPLPVSIIPCVVHRPPPLPPKRPRRVLQVGDVPRPRVPPRFYVDDNNNIAVEHLMVPEENRPASPVEQNVTQNLNGHGFNF